MENKMKFINQTLGLIYQTIISLPWILLATASSLFLFLDPLMRGNILKALLTLIGELLIVPLMFFQAITISLKFGWERGIWPLIGSIPARINHMFMKQIPFGLKESKSVSAIFKSELIPIGLDGITGTNFFGRLTLKFMSLILPMESYLAYQAASHSAHVSGNVELTEKILRILKNKHSANLNDQKKINILTEVEIFLRKEKKNNTEELGILDASLRCVDRFKNYEQIPTDIDPEIACAASTALCYVWLEIKHEGNDSIALKNKLIKILWQIQRGFNLIEGTGGADLQECPTAQLGLLVRVICDEEDIISGYPSTKVLTPADFTESVQATLNRPFQKKGLLRTLEYHRYNLAPNTYKERKKREITDFFKDRYRDQTNGPLSPSNIDELIDAGVDAWEPRPPHH